MSENLQNASSPIWGRNTKLVVALTLVVIIGALLVKFQFIINPLFISLLLAYLFYPLAEFLHKNLRLSWGMSVGFIYFLFVILLVGLLAWGGVSLAQQGLGILEVVKDGITRLPELIQDYSSRTYDLYFLQFTPITADLTLFSEQAASFAELLIGQLTTLLATFAGGAANFLGWTLFVIFVSYFIAAESGGMRSRMISLEIPGYAYDVSRLTRELSRIWNAFLRGQIIIFFMTILIYIVVLELLGVSYAITLAFIAGLARFLPYVGPAINWVVLVLIAYFQDAQLFDMSPLAYAALVLVITIVVDMAIDYVITPRIYSDTLQVHPAAVLVAAIIAASLFGVLGVVVSAPILASAMLLWQYTMNKMLDRDPWQGMLQHTAPPSFSTALKKSFAVLALKFKKRK